MTDFTGWTVEQIDDYIAAMQATIDQIKAETATLRNRIRCERKRLKGLERPSYCYSDAPD